MLHLLSRYVLDTLGFNTTRRTLPVLKGPIADEDYELTAGSAGAWLCRHGVFSDVDIHKLALARDAAAAALQLPSAARHHQSLYLLLKSSAADPASVLQVIAKFENEGLQLLELVLSLDRLVSYEIPHAKQSIIQLTRAADASHLTSSSSTWTSKYDEECRLLGIQGLDVRVELDEIYSSNLATVIRELKSCIEDPIFSAACRFYQQYLLVMKIEHSKFELLDASTSDNLVSVITDSAQREKLEYTLTMLHAFLVNRRREMVEPKSETAIDAYQPNSISDLPNVTAVSLEAYISILLRTRQCLSSKAALFLWRMNDARYRACIEERLIALQESARLEGESQSLAQEKRAVAAKALADEKACLDEMRIYCKKIQLQVEIESKRICGAKIKVKLPSD